MSSLSLLLGETDHGEERVEPKLRRAWWWERAKEGWQPGRAISRWPIGSIEVRHDLQLDRITSVLIATSTSYDSPTPGTQRDLKNPRSSGRLWAWLGGESTFLSQRSEGSQQSRADTVLIPPHGGIADLLPFEGTAWCNHPVALTFSDSSYLCLAWVSNCPLTPNTTPCRARSMHCYSYDGYD